MSSSHHSHSHSHHSHGAVHKKSLLDGVDLRHPILKGYMYKQSHIHKAFNRRFFALYSRVMVYYESENEFYKDVSRGHFEHRHRAIRLDGVYLTKPEKKPKGARFCFILHCPDKFNERNEFLLVTDSREERREWMEQLQKQNPKLLDTHESSASGNTLQVPGARKVRADSATPDTIEAMRAAGNGDVSSHSELDIRDDRSDIVDMPAPSSSDPTTTKQET